MSRWNLSILPLVLAALFAWSACDAVQPVEEEQLVIEAFLDAQKPLPHFTLRHTRPLSQPYPFDATTAVTDASVALYLDTETIAYAPVPEQPGVYAPPSQTPAPARTPYRVEVLWQDQQAVASGMIPPPIHIDSLKVTIPDTPAETVLLDSLRLDTLGVDTRQGFIYPIEVTLWWTSPFEETGVDSAYWIEPQLRPFTPFSSLVTDFFLRPAQVLRERDLDKDGANRRQWTGVYAVPVDAETKPVPPHQLTVALLRSGADYARFASSRSDPDRREPLSNITGALGIVTAISLDSLQLQIE